MSITSFDLTCHAYTSIDSDSDKTTMIDKTTLAIHSRVNLEFGYLSRNPGSEWEDHHQL